MKKSNNITNNGGPQRVHFEFTAAEAESVCTAGTFNEWQPKATPMVALGGGRWAKDLMLAPGSYEYCFVVDSEWMPDPLAGETAPNPYGGVNSVRQVGNGAGR